MKSPTRRGPVRYQGDDAYQGGHPGSSNGDRPFADDGEDWLDPTRPLPPSYSPADPATWPRATAPLRRQRPPGALIAAPGEISPGARPRRRRIPLRVKLALAVAAAGLIFRQAIASVVLAALSAALHFVGVNVHLPDIRFGWPWQEISRGVTRNVDLGPWVLQKIEGISRPALGQANFTFYFTHKVSKSLGPFPCWYASTFYAVGHASATVDLNPGPAWWTPASGHYRLQVLSRPSGARPGRVAVTMVLPQPQLPRSVHDVTIDNVPSKPIDTQHSWTYPGFGCGVLLQPQFPQSVLYAQAQQIAFFRARHDSQITGPLIRTAETTATQTIRDNFVQPTLNAFRYSLDQFTLRWTAVP